MYDTIEAIQQANAEAGFFFFNPPTMSFFKCRVLDGVYGGCYFVTSERGPDMPRRYTVRKALENGDIETMREFGKFSTASQARAAAAKLAKGVAKPCKP